MCCVTSVDLANIMSQYLHFSFFSPVWMTRCDSKWAFWRKLVLHRVQVNFLIPVETDRQTMKAWCVFTLKLYNHRNSTVICRWSKSAFTHFGNFRKLWFPMCFEYFQCFWYFTVLLFLITVQKFWNLNKKFPWKQMNTGEVRQLKNIYNFFFLFCQYAIDTFFSYHDCYLMSN